MIIIQALLFLLWFEVVETFIVITSFDDYDVNDGLDFKD